MYAHNTLDNLGSMSNGLASLMPSGLRQWDMCGSSVINKVQCT